MSFMKEFDEVLANIHKEIVKQREEDKRPKYVIISKPIEYALKFMNKGIIDIEKANKLFGLELIVLDREDIFYLVG